MPTTFWEGVCPSCGQAKQVIGACIICHQPVCQNCGGEAEGKSRGGWLVVHEGDCAMQASNQGLIWSPWRNKWR